MISTHFTTSLTTVTANCSQIRWTFNATFWFPLTVRSLSSNCHLSDFYGLLRHNRCHFKWIFIATLSAMSVRTPNAMSDSSRYTMNSKQSASSRAINDFQLLKTLVSSPENDACGRMRQYIVGALRITSQARYTYISYAPKKQKQQKQTRQSTTFYIHK